MLDRVPFPRVRADDVATSVISSSPPLHSSDRVAGTVLLSASLMKSPAHDVTQSSSSNASKGAIVVTSRSLLSTSRDTIYQA